MFSTCKTPHEALAALLLLALPEGMQLELPETLREKKGEDGNGYFCSREILFVAQNDSSDGENAPCF